MPNRSSDILFLLIHSLAKAEKRHFKLFITRNSSNENLKIVQLFNAMDKLQEYDEKALLKKLPDTTKSQLSNLKTYLYKQVLASLRLLKSTDSIDLQLNEQFDYAHILYKKGLFLQSLRLLEKAKENARMHQKFHFLTQVIGLEKRIESLHITESMQDRAESLSEEAVIVSSHIDMVAKLSNLALRLYSWYIKNGHSRDKKDEATVTLFFKTNLPPHAHKQEGFFERLYLYQSFSWYAFIRQDFLMYYRYAQKWVDLFNEQPIMKRVETGHYIKGLHNLLNAHFDLHNHQKFEVTISEFEAFAQTSRVQDNDIFRVQSFLYITQAKINQHFMLGTFSNGLALVPAIEEKLIEYALFIDIHRVMVLNYKIAMLYFGSGDYSKCIDYLHKIIHNHHQIRYDLQCYARVLHLLAHYELGNYELMDSLTKSVYRFMAKKKNHTKVEEEMFKFLRHSFTIAHHQVKPELVLLLKKIKGFEKNRFETRTFAYLDIVSWVESKVIGQPLHTIIEQKHTARKHRVYK
ncbi:MAG TPA: hypothetical protein VM888_04885 [Chitinophagaceae bacterium]|nr:hypothetical protein [Chitinophagaceae bacterium]